MTTRTVSGWGRATASHGLLIRPQSAADWAAVLAGAGPRGLIVRGGGCGYGDVAQNAGGIIALSASDDRLSVEGDTAVLPAGMTLGAVVRALAPLGWTLPVVPGTGHATVGGAIAADVHGKNHVTAGTFGAHVREMTVLTPSLGEVVLGPASRPDAFRATVGGLGLTGVIRQARVGLVPLGSWQYRCTDIVRPDLDAMLSTLRAAAGRSAYAMGWIGNRRGGGVVSVAQPLQPRTPAPRDGGPAPTWPMLPTLPGTGIGTAGVTAAANRARLLAARVRPRQIRTLPQVLFPLDAIRGWAGLHGRNGLVQYQFVVPFGAEDVLRAALQSRPTLATLKVFGAAGDGFLSFPLPGWSLALDYPATADLGPALDALDERVAAAGGRVYLVKDSRLRPELLSTMYPQLNRWRAERALLDPDRVMVSDLDRRLGLSTTRVVAHA